MHMNHDSRNTRKNVSLQVVSELPGWWDNVSCLDVRQECGTGTWLSMETFQREQTSYDWLPTYWIHTWAVLLQTGETGKYIHGGVSLPGQG